MGPRPVPTPWPILLKFNSHDYLVIRSVCWKFEVNRMNINEVIKRNRDGKERRKIKKKNNKEKTKRKQKGFRLKSETLTRLDQSNVLDWQVSSILLKT